MISEKRICELLLPCYILFDLANDVKDRCSRTITNYVGKAILDICQNDRKKAHKISIRLAKKVHEIN